MAVVALQQIEAEAREQGQPLLVNGVAWQQYLMLLMMSTKLLTECDKVLKVKPSASCRQWLGAGSKLILKRRVLGNLCRARGLSRTLLTVLQSTSQP